MNFDDHKSVTLLFITAIFGSINKIRHDIIYEYLNLPIFKNDDNINFSVFIKFEVNCSCYVGDIVLVIGIF